MSAAANHPDKDAESLAAHGIVRLRADNPGPITLTGTNTWVLGSDPCYVVDPGPALEEHLSRVVETVDAHGGLGGIALTHDHIDHSEAVEALRARRPAPVAAARGNVDVELRDGISFGPMQVLETPGHALDHVALIAGRACFCGDAVLGEGSVFIAPDPGALAAYLDALGRLRQLDLDVLCPGHGPPVWDPAAKIDKYVAHRLERERLLLAAIADGRRSVHDLLDAAWFDVPAQMRPVAAITLAAHLDKLAGEGRLPEGVERPAY